MKTLPCPFCGSSSQEIYDLYYDGSHVLVFCKCGAQAGEAEDEEGAISLWNTRIPLVVVPQESYQLPCPFCSGSEQEKYKHLKDFWLWCKCGAQGSHAKNREAAKSLWNTRISQALEKK